MTVGKDNFVFEAGPFNTIAVGSLTAAEWECDFDAVCASPRVVLLQIPRALYHDASVTSRRIVAQVDDASLLATDEQQGFPPSPRPGHVAHGLPLSDDAHVTPLPSPLGRDSESDLVVVSDELPRGTSSVPVTRDPKAVLDVPRGTSSAPATRGTSIATDEHSSIV